MDSGGLQTAILSAEFVTEMGYKVAQERAAIRTLGMLII